MAANTDQRERLIDLCSQAIRLERDGSRTPEQVEKLLQALQDFKDAPSAKSKRHSASQYPGCFGNKCSACGGCIDEGGICPCGWDHDRQIKVA